MIKLNHNLLYTIFYYKFKMIKNLIDNISNVFADNNNIIFAYLFGSIPKGNERYGSDLDIAIYFNTEPTFDEIGKLVLQLEELSDYKIDLVQMNQLDSINPVLAYTIISEGKIVSNKIPDILTEFKTSAILKYFDFKTSNDIINKSFSYRLLNNSYAVFEK